LTNPAGARRQVMGVYDPSRVDTLARVLGALGSERVFVVHGFRERGLHGGLDDLSPEGASLVWELHRGELQRHTLHPEDAGLERDPIGALAGESAAENAEALEALLEGEKGAYRRAVQYAGGLTLVVAGDEPLSTLPEQAQRIAEVLDDGSAKRVLERLRDYSTGTPDE
jgi:anthranilate phosphoribosyltransferase